MAAPDPPEPTADVVYLRLEGDCHLAYGNSEPTRLTVTAIDKDGNAQTVVFEANAFRQLSILFRDIAETLPGAVLGH